MGGNIYVGAALHYKFVTRMIFSQMMGRDANLTEDLGSFVYPFSAIEVQPGHSRHFTPRANGERYELSDKIFDIERVRQRVAEFEDKLIGSLTKRKQPEHKDDQHYKQLIFRNGIDRTILQLFDLPYTTVHAPGGVWAPPEMREDPHKKLIDCNLGDHRPEYLDRFLDAYKDMMWLAHRLGAKGLVVHPTAWGWIPKYKWRMDAKERFFESFRQLAAYHRENGFNFAFLIENLEFNKYPSTAEELEECHSVCTQVAESEGLNDKVYICLDLQHMRHSYKIINEAGRNGNYQNLEKMKDIDALVKGFDKAHHHFAGYNWNENWQHIPYVYDIFTELVRRQVAGTGNVRVIHVAGNSDESSTHDAIRRQSDEWHLHHYQLNLKKMTRELVEAGFKGSMVLEVHGEWEDKINSVKVIQDYLRENGVNL